jgi:hypothetical protein
MVERWAEQMDKSGEDLGPLVGSLVGEFSLRILIWLPFKASRRASPRALEDWQEVEEYQAGSWALKSPRIRQSFSWLKSLGKSGE